MNSQFVFQQFLSKEENSSIKKKDTFRIIKTYLKAAQHTGQ